MGFATITGMEVFQAGIHRDMVYTVADLDSMVRNFYKFIELVSNPLVVGHEEDQELLDNTGLPAAGWVTRLYRRGSKLFADIGYVPKLVADLVNRKAYRKVSAEIYDEPPEGVPAEGKMLRRIAILGGELPQIKSLRDIPQAVFAERIKRQLRPGKFTRYFKESAMDRKQMETMALAWGFSQKFLDLLDDKALAQLVTEWATDGQADADSTAPPADAALSDVQWPDGMDRAAVIGELVVMGEQQAALEALPDDQLVALWTQKKGAPMADDAIKPGAAASTPPSVPGVPSGTLPSKVTLAFSEMERRQKAIETRQTAADTLTAKRIAQEKKRTINAFCERMVKENRLTPAQVEPGKGSVRLRLERADALKVVHKFKEAGVDQEQTELDLQMAEIEREEPRRFGEKILGRGRDPQNAELKELADRTKKYAERHKYASRN